MKKSARKDFLRSCLMRHILVLMDDTLRAILICLRGGGHVCGVTYPSIVLPGLQEERVEKQLAECKRWLDTALLQSGIDRKKGYRMSSRERNLVNAKISRINRWSIEQKLDQWREIIITLAVLNVAMFWARLELGDTAHRRMVYIEVDKLCLLLGDGSDWILSQDLFDFCRKSLLDGLPATNLRAEEEFFFRFLAMPMPRTDTERLIFEETGRAANTAALLAM